MADFNPSRCTVEKATLTPYGDEGGRSKDITLMIGGFTIRQSIDSVAMSGDIQVLDAIGLLEEFPLRGEEKLELEIKTYDNDTTRKITAQIYRISDVMASDETKKVTYTLHWVSKTSFDAGIRKQIAAFNKKRASQIVKEIFEKYYSKLAPFTTSKTDPEEIPDKSVRYNIVKDQGRKLYLQETDETLQVTIPDYSPSEAISFVAARAHTLGETKSSSFRFFETWDGYYFVTDEWLTKRGAINRVQEFFYNPNTGQDALNAAEQVKSLVSFKNPRRADVGEELNEGAYRNSIFEIDLLRHTAKRYNYSYLANDKYKFNTSTGKKASYKTDIHTQKFAEEVFTDENAKRFMLLRDYRTNFNGVSFRDEMNFKEIAAKRMMFNQHMQATQVAASTRGRLDIQAGDVIKVNIKDFNTGAQQESNKQLSGRYLVTEVVNVVSEGVLTTSMSLFKYGWSDAGIDPDGGLS